MAETDQNAAIAEFVSITGASAEVAQVHLAENEYDVGTAVGDYYQSMEEDANEEMTDEPSHPNDFIPHAAAASGSSGAGRRLGAEGDPTPAPSASSSSALPSRSDKPKPSDNKKMKTLKDLQSDSHAGHGHDDDDSDKEQEFYAGGDKSGLAVQDPSQAQPSDQIKRLMNTARRGAPRPPRPDGQEDEPARPTHFTGGGQTLGGDDIESQYIPGPNTAQQRPATEMVERTLHLWEDGFSIDDGPLYRFDDPANRRTLDMINSGSAPMDLMGVQSGQAVDVKLDQHHGEKYKQPKKKYKPFESGGQRLGSPTPGIQTSAPPPSIAPATAQTAQLPAAPTMDVDSSQPTLSLRVQLADGTRMPSRFNTSHTIGDVYDFVNRATPGGQTRPYVLATTFPTKDLTDKAQILGDMAEFKRGGVVVQKWT